MREEYILETVELQTLYNVMISKQREGYRLAQICATGFEGYNELIYSVVKDYDFENYKVIVPADVEISSLSDVFPSAMLFENEMTELYGVKIKSINPDYQNKLYRIATTTPFMKEAKEAVKIVKADEAKAEAPQEAAPQAELSSGKIVNDMSKCILCGLCSRKCPGQCITVDRKEAKTWTINRDTCIQCGACIDACAKFKALSFAEDDGESGEVVFKKEVTE